MSLSNEASRRCQMETLILELFSPLVSENIFVVSTNTINIARCLIIGPDDTPYENGFYLYEIRFPNDYPYSPPKAIFYTNDGNVRMHPNYYTSGKVCVSLIGTWAGPGWTSCNTLSSVLLTFRSLFIENPLWQEPGFKGDTSKKNNDYNLIITYENYRIAIIQMFKNPPKGFEVFREIMCEHLVKNKDKIYTRLNKLYNKNKTVEKYSPNIYKFTSTINYKKIIEDLDDIYKNQIPKIPSYNTTLDELLKIIPDNTNITPKKLTGIFNNSDIKSDIDFAKLINILEMRNQISRNHKGHIIKNILDSK